MELKEYWDRKIIEWEKSSYQGRPEGLGLIEKIATKFRTPIKRRREILLGILKEKVKNKTILELGCGSGDLCFELLNLGANKVIGIDIADEAIRAAKAKAAALGLGNKAEFSVMDVRRDINLPDTDFIVGLGFIDYIDPTTLKKLFAEIKGKFIFSFPEKKKNVINLLHYIYLKSQRCPAFYKFGRREFINVPGMIGRCHFFTKDNMTFIANFNPDTT